MIRLILFIVVSVTMIGGTCMAENVSTCPVDTVPIKILNRRGNNPVTTLSVAKKSFNSGTPSFNALVTTVTEHLAAKLAQENLCLNSAESQERSLVQFVFMHLGTKTLNPSLPPEQPSDGCRISSPWIDIDIERGPVPSVRAVVRFSEHQLLADQAVLAGAQNIPPGSYLPLEGEEFSRYIIEYLDRYGIDSVKKTFEKPIEEIVPPDILWLLDRTQDNDFPSLRMNIGATMGNAMEAGAEAYTKIVNTLIDHCFASGGANINYNSVNDVADLLPLEQYKVDMPYIRKRSR